MVASRHYNIHDKAATCHVSKAPPGWLDIYLLYIIAGAALCGTLTGGVFFSRAVMYCKRSIYTSDIEG